MSTIKVLSADQAINELEQQLGSLTYDKALA